MTTNCIFLGFQSTSSILIYFLKSHLTQGPPKRSHTFMLSSCEFGSCHEHEFVCRPHNVPMTLIKLIVLIIICNWDVLHYFLVQRSQLYIYAERDHHIRVYFSSNMKKRDPLQVCGRSISHDSNQTNTGSLFQLIPMSYQLKIYIYQPPYYILFQGFYVGQMRSTFTCNNSLSLMHRLQHQLGT